MTSVQRFSLIVVILAFIGWAGFARVIRGMVLSLKEQEFVVAAVATGASKMRIIVKHILPQTMSYVIVAMTLSIPSYILSESGLSFLGLGIQQPDASWGNMLKEAQEFVEYIMKQGYKVYVLSNASDTFYDYFPRFRPIEDFDGIVVSADIHMIKPDEGIYRYLTDKYNLESEECLFIDDRKENVDTALQLGWQAEIFEGDFEKIKEKYQL